MTSVLVQLARCASRARDDVDFALIPTWAEAPQHQPQLGLATAIDDMDARSADGNEDRFAFATSNRRPSAGGHESRCGDACPRTGRRGAHAEDTCSHLIPSPENRSSSGKFPARDWNGMGAIVGRLPPPCFSRSHTETESRHRSFCDLGCRLAAHSEGAATEQGKLAHASGGGLAFWGISPQERV
jgi:hypothetical protein